MNPSGARQRVPLHERLADASSRSKDFGDLVDMNGEGCGGKQVRILSSYESWGGSSASYRGSGRRVDGLSGRRAATEPASS